jgi:hypothetical protein
VSCRMRFCALLYVIFRLAVYHFEKVVTLQSSSSYFAKTKQLLLGDKATTL